MMNCMVVDSEFVTREEFDNVRQELNAKLMELEQKILQINKEEASAAKKDSRVPSITGDLGNPEKDYEEDAAAKEASEEPRITDEDSADSNKDAAARDALVKHLKVKVRETYLYQFQESTWDVTMFAFISPLRHVDSMWTAVVGVLNIAVQITFCLLIQANFTESDDQLAPAREWRKMNGHWQKYADDIGTSLAARVCNEDLSMELSGAQLMMYQDAKGYVSTNSLFLKDVLQTFNTAVGPLSCFLCLSLWYLSSLWNELDCCWRLFKALFHVPWARHTSLRITEEGFAIVNLAFARLLLIIIMTLSRMGIACLLFYSGSVWLADTVGVTDLVLNAAALAFILEIDNIICGFMIPRRVLCFVQNVQPIDIYYERISLSSQGGVSHVAPTRVKLYFHNLVKLSACVPWRSLACFSSMLAFTTFTYNNRVLAKVSQLSDAVDAYCKEPTNFLVETHGPTGIVFTWSQEVRKQEDSLMQQVVQDMMDNGSSSKALESSSWLDFRTYATLPLEDFIAKYGACHDFKHDQPHLKAPLRRAVGKHGLQTCDELSNRDCMESDPIVRFACPEKCGCTSPYAGFFMLTGCPLSDCQALDPDTWKLSRYEDITPIVLRSLDAWRSYWDSYIHAMKGTYQEEKAFANLSASVISERFIELGCNAIQNISNEIGDAQTTLNYFCKISSERRSLGPFCPKQCVCSARDQTGFCPTKETTSSSICGDLVVSKASITACEGYLKPLHNPNGTYTCFAKEFNGKNIYRLEDYHGVLWEIRWETKEHFDWGATFAGSKIGLNGTGKWTLRSVHKSEGGPMQEAVHYFSTGGNQSYPTEDWIPRTVSNTDKNCAEGAMVTFPHVRYHILDRGVESCPNGFSVIHQEVACRAVARAWGTRQLRYVDGLNTSFQFQGCIIDPDSGHVRFNLAPSIKQGGFLHRVCEVNHSVHLFDHGDLQIWLGTRDVRSVSKFTEHEWYYYDGHLRHRGNWSYLDGRRIGLYELDWGDPVRRLAFVLEFSGGGMIRNGTDAKAVDTQTQYEFTVSFHNKTWSSWESLLGISPWNPRFSRGDCTVDLMSNCLFSPNYPSWSRGDYRCSVDYAGQHSIHAFSFYAAPGALEVSFRNDSTGEVQQKTYGGTAVPVNVKGPLNITFEAHSASYKHFELCEVEGCMHFNNSESCPGEVCAWDGLFCRDPGMNSSISGSNACVDHDHAKDREGHDCNFYTANPHMCGYGVLYLDNYDFTARSMCCACGGGSRRTPTHSNNSNHTS